MGAKAEQKFLRAASVPRTWVRSTIPMDYEIKTRQELAQAAAELMGEVPVRPAPLVDLIEDGPLELELAATLIYSGCHHSYRQVRERGQGLTRGPRTARHCLRVSPPAGLRPVV